MCAAVTAATESPRYNYTMKPRDLMRYRGRPVRVYLYDGVAFDGVFQTEVLSDSAVSVCLEYERRDLALAIEDIVDVLPPSTRSAQVPA
jgi:hypothetical protein